MNAELRHPIGVDGGVRAPVNAKLGREFENWTTDSPGVFPPVKFFVPEILVRTVILILERESPVTPILGNGADFCQITPTNLLL
jgi:hypothetical protein